MLVYYKTDTGNRENLMLTIGHAPPEARGIADEWPYVTNNSSERVIALHYLAILADIHAHKESTLDELETMFFLYDDHATTSELLDISERFIEQNSGKANWNDSPCSRILTKFTNTLSTTPDDTRINISSGQPENRKALRKRLLRENYPNQ